MSTRCQFTNEKTKRKGGGRTWVYSHETWNLAFLAMEVKTFRITSWDVVDSPPWEQWKRWVPTEFKGWPQMQWVISKTNGWGRPNLVPKAKEKTSKSKQKGGMTKWANSQAFAFGFAQDFKSAQCESKAMSKMMLEKEWSCNLF